MRTLFPLPLLFLLLLVPPVAAEWYPPDPLFPGTNPSLLIDTEGVYWIAYTYWVEDPSLNETSVDIYLRRSEDGISWSDPLRVTTHPKPDGDPSLIQDRNGTYWILFTSSRGGGDSLYLTASRDGANWSEPIFLLPPGIDGSYPHLFQDRDGVYWASFSLYDRERRVSEIALLASEDGARWTGPWRVTREEARATFPQMVQDREGRYWMVVSLHREGPENHLYLLTSEDGRHWSEPVRLTRFPAKNNYPALMRDREGRLWLAFTSTISGEEDLFLMGSPDGERWSSPVQLTYAHLEGRRGKADYKDLAVAPNGDFWLVYRSGGIRRLLGKGITLEGAKLRRVQTSNLSQVRATPLPPESTSGPMDLLAIPVALALILLFKKYVLPLLRRPPQKK
jgi:beta-xylosidase